MNAKDILERTFRSLIFCDNMGDVLEAIDRAAELADIELPEHESLDDLLESEWAGGDSLWDTPGVVGPTTDPTEEP